MAFDRKRLERDERQRYDRLALVLGTVFTVLGASGIVVSLVLGHPAAATGNVVWLLIGVASLVAGLRARNDPGPRPSDEPPDLPGHGDDRSGEVQAPSA